MQYVDEFRDPELAKALLQRIQALVDDMPQWKTRPLQLMEVCGGHTHAIFKFGIDGCCRRRSSLFTGRVARCACCRWGGSTPVWRSPPVRR